MTAGAIVIFGLLSSLHCALMCAPLAIAGTAGPACGAPRRWLGYLGARLLAYTTGGAVMGALGQHALCILPLGVVQGVTSALLAVFAIVQGVRLLRPVQAPALVPLGRSSGWTAALAQVLPRRGAALGLATAILPCGASMAAYAIAAASAAPLRGAGVMFLFALASTPGVVAPALARLALGTRRALASPTTRACAWWLLAVYGLLRPLVGAHHH